MSVEIIDLDRDIRRIKNSSQASINVDGFSTKTMSEGDLKFTETRSSLTLNKKHKGLLWKSNFSKDGNQLVEKDLTVKSNLHVNGNIYGSQTFWYSHNFNYTGTDKVYIGWNRSSGNTGQEVYGKFITPFKGRLLNVLVRSESAGGSSVVGFHKAEDTTTDPNGTATEAITVNMSAADTTYDFKFTQAAKFNRGDVIALSIDATNAVNDINATSIFLFEINV
tara:strand:- start:2319 stop:2984 length:666 start_codon:yes stop_codon:yes gene_type:complete